MKKTLISAAVVALAFAAFAKKSGNSDPILMNVAGQDVPLSEFEYLYHKNNAQQIQPQTLEKYVDMFVDYKLKVADARAAGLDTTQAFRDEFVQFRDDLARPYLRDSVELDRLIAEAYSHMGEDVTVSHIMLPPVGRDGQDPRAQIAQIRADILSGKTTFEDAAKQQSVDKPSARRGGLMGNVTPGRFPYAFEEAAYNTAVGEISEPVNSGFGWHIIRVEKRSPAKGEVEASHILKLTRGMDAAQAAVQKHKIDSIYEVVAAGADFAEVAKRESEDPGSARNGGSLGWFGPGMMVQEFDSVSFALPVDGLSKPFATSFGYHIIKKTGARGVKPLSEMRPMIEKAIESDYRASLPERSALNQVAARTGSSINSANVDNLAAALAYADSAAVAAINASTLAAYKVGGHTATFADVLASSPLVWAPDAGVMLQNVLRSAVERAYYAGLTDLARVDLESTNTDYRNLVNEYRDGILLFEISNRNVWDRAAKDKEGLDAFFNANRDKYAWDEPRFKSTIIFASNDSILAEAKKYTETLPADLDHEQFVKDMRKRFGRDVKVERVIAAKGENAITDYLGFGGPRPEAKNNRWDSYFAFRPQVIEQPREASDVRGAVVTDYQTQLEQNWIKSLREKYPVKINKKILKKVK